MTPEQESDLVERMAVAAYGGNTSDVVLDRMRAALRIAEPVIRDAALEEAEERIREMKEPYRSHGMEMTRTRSEAYERAAEELLSLRSTTRPAPQETK